MKLQEKVKSLPASPGVYFMKDSQDLVIYVGKAKNLRNRVSSYFRNNKGHSPKIKKLVQHLKDFDYILTDTEFEAFMLECHMIKELKPIYNRVMKNPQAFCYIQILLNQGHQDIKITYHPIEKDGNLYFGPFTNRSSVEKAILGIKEGYKILCGHRYKKGQPCLNYSLGLCRGICLGGPVEKEYQQILDKIIALLNGTDMILIDEMKKMMLEASEQFDFEAAAKYRDYIEAVHSLLNKEKVIAFTEEDHQILMTEPLGEQTFKLFLIKRTDVLFSEKFRLDSTNQNQNLGKIKNHIHTHFKTTEPVSSLQVSKYEIDQAQIIYSYLKRDDIKLVIIPKEWL
ncbi:MAG TPA: UvrB/UvrC motif-containing protein, partial [Pseudoneobacillus sp.]|nr:UvrB/UvrC motif-containing protein [Pseudoneobacillus sp.]